MCWFFWENNSRGHKKYKEYHYGKPIILYRIINFYEFDKTLIFKLLIHKTLQINKIPAIHSKYDEWFAILLFIIILYKCIIIVCMYFIKHN